jgi:phenylacetic acid degradation operon negative regulatory protein
MEGREDHALKISELISQCWDMEGVARQYQEFLATFGPMHAAAQSGMTPDQAFAVRALTLHEWRRIVLHDPQLPLQMLPDDWPGLAARNLCSQLYWSVFEQAESHLQSVLGQDTEHFLPLRPYVYTRFGGVKA